MIIAKVYQWSGLPVDAPMDLLERRRVIGTQAMISHITLKRGFRVPTHAHDNEQFSVVLTGRLRFGIGADGSPQRHDATVGPGQVIHLPAGVPHSAEAEEDTVVLDVFSPPSQGTGIDRH